MRFGVEFVPYMKIEKMVKLAREVERGGFEQIWVCDHYHNRNVYVALAEIARMTRRVKLGPGVTNPYLVHPAVTANAIGTLQELSRGRGMLGISAGDRFFLQTVGVKRRKPIQAVREAITIIRGLLRGERVEFKGEVFECHGSLRFRPDDEIPIYVGGRKRQMLKLAGEMADGALINASDPADIQECIGYIREGLKKEGKKNFDSVAYMVVSIDRDLEKARKAARGVVAFVAASAPESSLERHGISLEDVKRVRKMLATGRLADAREAVNEKMIGAFSICGKVDEFAARIEELKKLGVTTAVAGFPIGPKPEAALREIFKEVGGG
ncbi:MAG: 5,10-methylenetetrahydromethanopterin reductase [Candidatus Hadarchaeales archaeon]